MEAKPPRRFRKLRIAWSMFFIFLAVVLALLWVRSYWRRSEVTAKSIKRHFGFQLVNIESSGGHIWANLTTEMGRIDGLPVEPGFYFVPSSSEYDKKIDEDDIEFEFGVDSLDNLPATLQMAGFHFGKYGKDDDGLHAIVPHWFLILVSAALAPLPWIRLPRRFSVRTMLIATTLVAIVLGLIVWATK
jgi:hypothetical protein